MRIIATVIATGNDIESQDYPIGKPREVSIVTRWYSNKITMHRVMGYDHTDDPSSRLDFVNLADLLTEFDHFTEVKV